MCLFDFVVKLHRHVDTFFVRIRDIRYNRCSKFTSEWRNVFAFWSYGFYGNDSWYEDINEAHVSRGPTDTLNLRSLTQIA